MSDERNDGLRLDEFTEWQFGIALLFLVVLVGGVSATVLQSFDVPYAGWIGGVGGGAAAFLAVSYWYYGR